MSVADVIVPGRKIVTWIGQHTIRFPEPMVLPGGGVHGAVPDRVAIAVCPDYIDISVTTRQHVADACYDQSLSASM